MTINRPHVVSSVFVVAAHLILTSLTCADTYQLDIKTDVDKGRAEGTMTLSYHNLGKQPLEKLRLRLDMNLGIRQIGSMTIATIRDNNGTELPWRYVPFEFGKMSSDRAQLEVDLPEPLDASGRCELQITFSLDDSRCLNHQMITLQDDPYHSFDAWYPKAMTKAGDGWSINDDRPSHYDVTIELPGEIQSVASTGKPLSSEPGDTNSNLFHLKADDVRGFTIYASPSWEEHRRTADGVDLGVHLPAEASGWADPMLDAAADVIAFYRSEYGEYPGDHLEIICPGSLAGRAHGSSATCNGITIWLHTNLKEQYRSAIAHEIAHQYLGSAIGIERREIAWAPIGLGLTMDHQYLVQRGIDETAFRKTIRWFYMEALRRGFDTRLSQPVEEPMRADPPWSSGWNMSLMHGKAYEVCTMLEGLLGKDKFREVVRQILREKRGGVLSGNDFIAYCRAASDEPLDWFIADWIDGNGALDYGVAEVNRTDGGWQVTVEKIGAAAYPVTVEAQTAGGQRLRQKIDRTKKVDRLSFATDEELTSVVIDPDNICPDLDDSNDKWPR